MVDLCVFSNLHIITRPMVGIEQNATEQIAKRNLVPPLRIKRNNLIVR
jgi:hypothetical protein